MFFDFYVLLSLAVLIIGFGVSGAGSFLALRPDRNANVPVLGLLVVSLTALTLNGYLLLPLELGLAFLAIAFSAVVIFLLLLPWRAPLVNLRIATNLALLVVIGGALIWTSSLVVTLLSFECLLLISLNLLLVTSKSERILEAAVEMFMWTVVGSIGLLIGFIYLFLQDAPLAHVASSASPLLTGLFIIGFGVKIPIWPALSWLLKAHVEASVEFSILLSGFIVKLGLVGLLRVLEYSSATWALSLLLVCAVIALIDAILRLFAQVDLKRIVALTTVIEMNWLVTCFIYGGEAFWRLGLFLALAHCFTTISEFFIVEAVSKRYGSRDVWHISGLWVLAPGLWYMALCVVLVTIGFPGTSLFIAKLLYLSLVLSVSPCLFFGFLVGLLMLIPLFFIRLWVPVWYGLPSSALQAKALDLTSKEVWVFYFSLGMGLCLGVYPGLVF